MSEFARDPLLKAREEWLRPDAKPADTGKPSRFDPMAAGHLIRTHPELRPEVVDGLLREGETMNIVAAPKVGKSYLAHSLAIAVAFGHPWLGRCTSRGRVLLIDAELHKETLAHRLASALKAVGGSAQDLDAWMDVWSVRGKLMTVDDVRDELSNVRPGTYRLIVLDALYRFLPLGGEENSNETMTRVYNTMDAIAETLRSAMTVVHHATKGNQSSKAVTDVGAGGGSQSRAADTHLVLRQHKEEGAVVAEAVVRSWKQPEPFVLRWANPGWQPAPDLDPKDLKTGRREKGAAGGDAKPPQKDWTPEVFAREVVSIKPEIREAIIERARNLDLSAARAERLFKLAVERTLIHRHPGGHSEPHRFSTTPPEPQMGLPSVGRGRGVQRTPRPPQLDAVGGMGGVSYSPSPPPAKRSRSKTKKKPEVQG